jgi:hypothetical protein
VHVRPQVLVGIALILFGLVVLALRGISYTKERQEVEVGPLEVAAERKGFIPPAAGVVALVVGAGLLIFARRRPG